jgi:hypothetical protein
MEVVKVLSHFFVKSKSLYDDVWFRDRHVIDSSSIEESSLGVLAFPFSIFWGMSCSRLKRSLLFCTFYIYI